MRVINCFKCSRKVKDAYNSQKYCDNCKKKVYQDYKNKFKDKNREKIREGDIEYYHKNKKIIIEKQMKRRNKNPIKYKVQQLTWKNNRKENICSKCKKKKDTDFHHLSYEPNKFIEVCRSCHKKIHFNLN